jgi:hypothetical protein
MARTPNRQRYFRIDTVMRRSAIFPGRPKPTTGGRATGRPAAAGEEWVVICSFLCVRRPIYALVPVHSSHSRMAQASDARVGGFLGELCDFVLLLFGDEFALDIGHAVSLGARTHLSGLRSKLPIGSTFCALLSKRAPRSFLDPIKTG